MKLLKGRHGEGYIDIVVAVLVISFLLILLVSVFGVVTKKQDLRHMCSELVEVATNTGQIGNEVEARYAELCAETGLSPTVTFETEYFDEANGTVQFGDTITCTLTVDVSLPGFGGEAFPFELTATQSGLSQIYWK